MQIKVIKENIMKANQDYVQKTRQLLQKNNTLMVNIISSPGSGKTSLLEKIIPLLKKENINTAVIEGDCYTTKDSERIQALDIPVIQINTEGNCHLDSVTVYNALQELDIKKTNIIFIENVGNLVCPTAFDLGEKFKIAVLSTTEGNDKPLKYPMLFRESRYVILNKIDLLEYTDFNSGLFNQDLKKLNPDVKIFNVSCRTGEGIPLLAQEFQKAVNSC